MTAFGAILLAAIELVGVTGDELRARAFFDANNVKVGDPLVLSVDFIGSADFQSLHPPALSRSVDSRDWKVDDASAKTQTDTQTVGGFFSSREVAIARRLTYRVRPMRTGVLWFPSLEFAYVGADGKERTVRANAIPVHAKPGAQVVVAEMGQDLNKMPEPAPLITKVPEGFGDDEAFAWRKACAKPMADDFAEFDAPEARLNEAHCAIREGNWARALKVCRMLEWRTGQTPEIERDIVAALALRYDNPAAELPVWRQVGRPILKYAWAGRTGIVLGGFAAVALVFWLLGKAIRVAACVTLAAMLALPAAGEDIFEQMQRQMSEMRKQMNQQMQQLNSMSSGGGISFSFGGGEREAVPEVTATLATEPAELQVGAPFRFIVSLEAPKSCSIGQIGIAPSVDYGLKYLGKYSNLKDGQSANPSNVVKRMAFNFRFDVPFKGPMSFKVTGQVTGMQKSGRANNSFVFQFSNSFTATTPSIPIAVKPLPGQPKDFSGIISDAPIAFTESRDLDQVETNDVICITYRLQAQGYVPQNWMPEGAAFDFDREDARNGKTVVNFRRFFVADGAPKTPVAEVVWYDTVKKAYRRTSCGGREIRYVQSDQ